MIPGSSVIVNLHSPREKIWGMLISVQSSGVTLRGLDLNSFDDWSREVAQGDASIGLSTLFVPMHRVERIDLDETVSGIPSMAAIFASRVGKDLWSYLGMPGPPAEALSTLVPGPGSGDDLRTLEEVEKSHIERVWRATGGDTGRASLVLAISPAELTAKRRAYGLDSED